jgi:hypothetical protein
MVENLPRSTEGLKVQNVEEFKKVLKPDLVEGEQPGRLKHEDKHQRRLKPGTLSRVNNPTLVLCHGKCSSNKLCTCVALRAMNNADMFGHPTVRHGLSHPKTTYYERHVRQLKHST